jgi:large subunit ribosomal protein L24
MSFPRIKKGDEVIVIRGDEKGKRGKVLEVDRKKGLVVVEKVNLVRRNLRPTPKNPQGGVLEKEAPIPVSRVMLWDPQAEKGTRVGVRFLQDGRKVRVRKCSGETVD